MKILLKILALFFLFIAIEAQEYDDNSRNYNRHRIFYFEKFVDGLCYHGLIDYESLVIISNSIDTNISGADIIKSIENDDHILSNTMANIDIFKYPDFLAYRVCDPLVEDKMDSLFSSSKKEFFNEYFKTYRNTKYLVSKGRDEYCYLIKILTENNYMVFMSSDNGSYIEKR